MQIIGNTFSLTSVSLRESVLVFINTDAAKFMYKKNIKKLYKDLSAGGLCVRACACAGNSNNDIERAETNGRQTLLDADKTDAQGRLLSNVEEEERDRQDGVTLFWANPETEICVHFLYFSIALIFRSED